MKKCSKCGTSLVENAKFCSKCGTPIQGEPLELAPKQVPQKKKKSYMLVVGVVIVALVGGYLFSQTTKKTSDSKNSIASSDVKMTEKESTAKKKVTKKESTALGIPYKNGDHFGLMDHQLKVINEDIGSATVTFNDQGISPFLKNMKWGLINSKGEIILEPKYEAIGRFNINHMNAYTADELQSTHGVMDFQVKNDGDEKELSTLTGLMDSTGKVILEPGEYMISPFMRKSMTTFIKNSSMGIISETGEIIVEPINDQCVILTDQWIGIKKNSETSKFEIVDLKGNTVKETPYESMYGLHNFDNHFVVTNSLGKSGILDKNLKEVMPLESSSYLTISDDHKYVVFNDKEKNGLKTIKGDVLIEAKYSYLSAPNKHGVMAYSENGSFGLMDVKGKKIGETFENSSLGQAYGTNLFMYTSMDTENPTTKILDSEGNVIVERHVFMGGTYSFPKGIYYIPDSNTENPEKVKATVLNEDGKVLSTEASFLSDLDKSLLIQEGRHIKIVDKKSGKIVKEKEI